MKNFLKRILAIVLTVIMLLTIVPLSDISGLTDIFATTAEASLQDGEISIGDKITLGNYNGNTISWICVDIDENGPLMLSEYVLCIKEFDAAGENATYHSDGWGYVREEKGSNCWHDSNIRQWLNTNGKVTYTHCPPSYSTEDGFMTFFTSAELSMVKTVTQKTYVNSWESNRNGYVHGGSKEVPDSYSIVGLERDYSSFWYQNVSDSFFLLNQEQLYSIYKNNQEYLLSSILCHSRVAGNSGASYEHVFVFGGSDANTFAAASAYQVYGIRPAFYLNVDAYKVEQSKITGEFQDYVWTILMDEDDNSSTSYISPIKIDGVEYKVRENVIETLAKADTYKGKRVIAYRDEEGYIYKIEPIEEQKTNEANWYQPITTPSVNYGVIETKATRASKVLEATNDFINAMQNYLNMLGDEVDDGTETININDIVKELKANKQAHKQAYFNLINAPTEAQESVYYAIASFIKDVANENQIYLKINPKDSSEKQASSMLISLISCFFSTTKIYYHGNYKVTLDNVYLAGQAFWGSVIVEKYKGVNKGVTYTGSIVSSEQRTKEVLVSYINNLGDIVEDQCKYALAEIQSDFMNLTGLAEADEIFLKTYFNNKSKALLEGKYGDVLQMFLNIKRSCDAIKNFYKECITFGSNAEDWLSFNEDQHASSLKKALDNLDVDYSLDGNVKWCVKSAMKSVEKAQKKLSDELYNYLYDVDTGDPNNKSGWEKFWGGNWLCSTVQCPVEFEVYDAQGNLLGYVDSSEKHSEYIDYNDEIFIVVENDVKYIYYPSDMEISVRFTAIDDGQMNYSIERFENGVPQGKINYFDVPLTLNEQFEQTIPASTDLIQIAETLTFEHSETSVVGEYISADEEAYITVDCTSDNQGFAIGGGEYPFGSSVKMMAFEDEGCKFQGWYLGDSLVSTDIVYQFTAVEDTEIYALFESVTDFVLKDDVDAKIDGKNKILVGNDILNYSADTIDSLFKYGNILIEGKEKGKIGTGDVVCAASDRGVICNTLTAVVFGDVNGDGLYDGQDAVIVSAAANGLQTEDELDSPAYIAADCNNDGTVNDRDVALLQSAGLMIDKVNQSVYDPSGKITVTYNGNGATDGTMESQVFECDIAQGLSKNEYTRSYKVTYALNGGTSEIRSINTDSEYAFQAWNSSKNGNGLYTYYDTESVTNPNELSNGNIELYAQWIGGKVEIPIPTKENYNFVGWYTDPEFNHALVAPDQIYYPTDNLTLYAKWEPFSKVSFNDVFDFDTFDFSEVCNGSVTVEHEDKSLTIYSTGIDTHTLNYINATKGHMMLIPGHTYRVSYDWANLSDVSDILRPHVFAYENWPASELDFFEQWLLDAPAHTSGTQTFSVRIPEGKPYVTVRFGVWGTEQGGTVVKFSNIHIQDITNPDGVADDVSMPKNSDGETVYNISVGYGNKISSAEKLNGSLPTITRTSYTFAGWYDSYDENGNGTGNLYDENSVMGATDLKLYAKWIKKE